MDQQSSHEIVFILHELNLGQHTLFIMSDGSIDLLAHHEEALYFADNMMNLDSEEAYRLFLSLREQFQCKDRVDQNEDDESQWG